MANYQTSVQKGNTIRFGSAKIEVGDDIGSLVNLGVATDIEFTEEFEPIILKPDNAPEIQVGIKEHTATAKFDMWEVDLSNLNLIRGGIDKYSTVAGTEKTVTNELHTLKGTGFVRLNYANGDGSEVTITTVKDSSNVTAVRNTDYVVGVDAAGNTVLARVAASTVITDGEQVKVSYKYTPNSAVKFSTGGLNTINPRIVRLTNTNAAGKKFQITIFAAKNQGGIELKLPSDDADESLKPTIELKGIVDVTRAAGEQLFEILDEQGV